MWALLALVTALRTSFNPLLDKRLLSQTGPVVVVWAVVGLAWPLLALTTVFPSPTLSRVGGVFIAAVAGRRRCMPWHLASVRSLELADAKLITPLLTISPVFTIAISFVLLGENPDARGLAGVGLVLVGAY